ncbi:NUDIX domain [Dermatophilus congolensis]|uniref:NUDIX domain n=1 Tax=Dermatophilus congolensis TaxID=1863 RepID=A0AA46BPF6_9MICO|nr:NUDIX hydrolase [Dermatophilus congolensis]STD12726.1 NUDIX domain [Dermatophilus congolensis]
MANETGSVSNPRRPNGPRNPADQWAEGPAGRFWGTNGAAGLLAHDPPRGVLLQHRAAWSDHGSTWGLPGGARHSNEKPIPGALREATEEAGVPHENLLIASTYTYDVNYWSYTTVIAQVTTPFEAVINDTESEELRWVPIDDVDSLPLHPGLAALWPQLRYALTAQPHLLIDIANVMGSRPDGWWKDRVGAAQRLLTQLETLTYHGIPGPFLGHPKEWHFWPEIEAVVEGQVARTDNLFTTAPPPEQTTPSTGELLITRANADGDSTILERLATFPASTDVTVVTSDRPLRTSAENLGARVVGSGSLLSLLPHT